MRTGKQKLILDIPGIQAKDHHTDEELKSLTLEALSVAYPSTTWVRAYTDRSAEEAAKNGRDGGVFIKLPHGRSIRKSVATGHKSTNHRAEACTLLAAAQTLNQEERLKNYQNSVFDWLPVHPTESSITRKGPYVQQPTQELSLLTNKRAVTLQWIPSHCGVGGNEEADPLLKMGRKLEQSAHPMSYSEAKATLRNNFRTEQ